MSIELVVGETSLSCSTQHKFQSTNFLILTTLVVCQSIALSCTSIFFYPIVDCSSRVFVPAYFESVLGSISCVIVHLWVHFFPAIQRLQVSAKVGNWFVGKYFFNIFIIIIIIQSVYKTTDRPTVTSI